MHDPRTTPPPPDHPPLAIMGGGHMATAILRGSIPSIINPARVMVAEIDTAKHADLAALGINVVSTPQAAFEGLRQLESAGPRVHGQLLLAVKPQMLQRVAIELAHHLIDHERIAITILAGTPSAKVRAAFHHRVRVIRAMPNLPASLRQGITAVAVGDGAKPGDEAFALSLFRALGPHSPAPSVIQIPESLMDAFTAIAGSGPAYAFYLAEAMEDAAIEMGFERDIARQVVAQTLAGAGAMLVQNTQARAAWLRASVTSKGGTTEAAIATLSEHGVLGHLIAAMHAAKDRGSELASL